MSCSFRDDDRTKKSGGAGYRSLCLLHAKQALYHLSYTPKVVCVVTYVVLHWRAKRKMRQPGVEPGAKAWEASMLPIHHWRSLGERHKSRRGGAGFRSLCLPIANRPLYRLSYTPGTEGTRHHLGPLTKSLVQAMGFEPMPLARLAPKASALTTRPNLQPHASQGGEAETTRCEVKKNKKWSYHKVPGGTRTPNPQIRSLMRYPLRHKDKPGSVAVRCTKKCRQQWDLNPRGQSPST
jgi:hypothetical protein